MILHQYWSGPSMGRGMRAWCEGVRAWAEARGMTYHLWSREEVEARFSGEPEAAIIARCYEVLPTATTDGLAGDWWRYRLLAEDGGLWLDTDYIVRDAARLNAWQPAADLAMMGEGHAASLPSMGCLWCVGERGQQAARVLKEAAGEALRRLLPIDATDFAARYIALARRDVCSSGIARHGIGPVRMRAEFLPRLQEHGLTHEVMPMEVCADRRRCRAAALLHWGSGTWREPEADWGQRAKRAAADDYLASLPPWQRPQGRALRTPIDERRQLRRASAKARQTPSRGLADGLLIPRGCKRIIIFSNLPAFDASRAGVREGDLCVHINRAAHYAALRRVPGTWHALLVRHGHDHRSGEWRWFEPESTDGMRQIIHIQDAPMRALRPWWQAYRRATGKCPTSGHIAWHLALEAAPTLPIILAGFAPGEPHGTPLWRGHAWEYEATLYRQAGATIIPP